MQQWLTQSGISITRLISIRSGVFLVSKADRHVLVDTSSSRAWRILQKKLTKMGIEHLDALVLTHAHYDHAGNAKRIRDRYGATVIIHSADAAYLREGKNPPINGTNFLLRPLVRLLGGSILQKEAYSPCPPDLIITDFFHFRSGDLELRLLPTPGHTQGSISILVDDEITLAGDTLFGVFPRSTFPPFAQDVPTLIKSWQRLLETHCTLFLPAHGGKILRKVLERNYSKRKETGEG